MLTNYPDVLRLCFSVFCESSEWGGDPGAVPATARTAHQRDGTRPTPGVLPPHRLQPLLPPHPPQRHAGVQHRYRSDGGQTQKSVFIFIYLWIDEQKRKLQALFPLFYSHVHKIKNETSNVKHLNSWTPSLFFLFFLFSDPAVAPALWVRHRPRAYGAPHSSAEPIGGHGLGGGGARRRGHVQLESAHQSAADEPGSGVLRVPVHRDKQH